MLGWLISAVRLNSLFASERLMEDSSSASSKSCVKVYLCSNPEDSFVERRALRELVFPRLREHCRYTHGLDFKVIDPYEDIDPRTWPDQRTRQNLIQECRETSAGPYLVALVGEKYGAACLPTQVEVAEFLVLLQVCQRSGFNTRALDRVYLRDENAKPASFCLQQQACSYTHQPVKKLRAEKTREPDVLEKEGEVRKVLQAAVSQCVQGGLLTPDRAQKYFRSVLDTDLRFALENRPIHYIDKRCVIYINKISSRKGQSEKADQLHLELLPHPHPLVEALSNDNLLSQICDQFLPSLVTSCHLLVHTTTSECEPRHGCTLARKTSYVEGLCQQLYFDVMALIDGSIGVGTGKSELTFSSADAWIREQLELCSVYSRLYEINRLEEEEVKAYLKQKDTQVPLVIGGGTCTGKTVLLAHCAQQVKSWLRDKDPVVIVHFATLSFNSSPRHVLSRLCLLIAHKYNHDPNPDLNATLQQLKQKLSSLLSIAPSPKRPLVLILDGLEQGSAISGAQIIQALPTPLPPNVKLLLSVSPTRPSIIEALQLHYPQSSSALAGVPGCCAIVELGSVERRECVRFLTSLLDASRREVTSGQQCVVNLALTSCPLTLYARLLHRNASLWTSESEVTESTLPVAVHPSIAMFLAHLEKKHGFSLVSRALSYLTLSRTGLTEAELSDLLSSDDEVLAEYVPDIEPLPSRLRVPEVDVERLLLDLKGFLSTRTIGGSQVLFWVSRHFGLVVYKRYLSTWEMREDIHSLMADYYNNRWCYGIAKPLIINHDTGTKQPGSGTAQIKLYLDRQPLVQPYVFNSEPSTERVNLRKLLELPYHLRASSRWEELVCGLMMSLEFHQAMLKAGLLGDLLTLLEDAKEDGAFRLLLPRERALLAHILRGACCLLWGSPKELPMVMQVRLLPYLGVFPELKGYAEEVVQGVTRRDSGLVVVLSPAPSSVPSTQCILPDAKQSHVKGAVATKCGTVVLTQIDGSAWMWRGCDAQQLELSCKPKVKFVHCSGSCVLLSTQCDRLFLYDVNEAQCFQEIQHAEGQVEGFFLCDDKMCVWWKGLSYASVGETSTGQLLIQLQCSYMVRTVALPSGGQFAFCGQEKGTVSVFDLAGGFLTATCSSATEEAIILLILTDDKEELTCVDKIGNIFLWDVETKAAPNLLRECYSESSHNEVVNTDLSEHNCFLLLCKTQEIVIWDNCNCELWDHFRAPQGKAFSQALLAQGGHLILASLEACLSVLVWKMASGQCVLSLDAGSQPLTLLKMESALSTVTQNGLLTMWDSEVIKAAGMAPKTGVGIRQVVLEQMGEFFYTIDGSEMALRWSLQTGSPDAHFLHDDPVKKLCLSIDGSHLVSLSGGDIYVWQSQTGQNLHRIHGSRATDVLVTSNCRLGVCVSQQGLSRAWKLASGCVVCNIHMYLADPQVSPESTFLLGLHHNDMLAVSLWSGTVSKRFSCSERYEQSAVLAFQTLPEHPEFVIVMASSGSVYTWRMTEETVCRQFVLPDTFLCEPRVFQMSCDGSFAVLRIVEDFITLLDLPRARLCRVQAEGPVLKVRLDDSGSYAVYICQPAAQVNRCPCDLHSKAVLGVVRLSDGGRVARMCLGKSPTELALSGELCVYVGFQDGSVGVYSICDVTGRGGAIRGRVNGISQESPCQCNREPVPRFPLGTPSVTWPELPSEMMESDL
ncbi:hypothetical protein UPYG_G00204420 [Umbra pygmaea]|uniref:NACHT domain-containing protein n=1 Tax=Umbra pygmaea TaxID=75934 RepID=A0ABD0WIW6_UMBPY